MVNGMHLVFVCKVVVLVKLAFAMQRFKKVFEKFLS